MAHVTIPDQSAFVQYTSQTGVGPYAVPFAVFEKADIVVLVAGVDIGQAGFTYAATSSTTGGYQTGEITLAVAAAAQDVVIYRAIDPKRTSDLGPGPQTRDGINSAFDRIHAILQDHEQELARCIRVSITETQGRLGAAPASGYTQLLRNSAGEVYEGGGSLTGLAPHSSWTSYLTGAIATTLFGDTSIVWTRLNGGDTQHYLHISASQPLHNFDSNDYHSYNRATNAWSLVIGATTRVMVDSTNTSLQGNLIPTVTESKNLGSASFEWNNIYTQNAVTVSDERRKNDLGEIDGDAALAFAEALIPRWFSYKDRVIPAREEEVIVEERDASGAAVQVKRTISHPEEVVKHGRPHAGFFAQQVKQAMKRVRWLDFAGYAYDAETDTHQLRLMEFIGLAFAAIKRLNARIAALDPGAGQRTIAVRGRDVRVSNADALSLFGALAICLDGETARVTLASGDILDLSHEDIPSLGRQLAGTPADEVSGPDRST